jgi:hypothetical protein
LTNVTFFVRPHTVVGRMMKKIILSFIAGVIIVQNGIADNKTAKVASRTFEPVSDLSKDAFPAPSWFIGVFILSNSQHFIPNLIMCYV